VRLPRLLIRFGPLDQRFGGGNQADEPFVGVKVELLSRHWSVTGEMKSHHLPPGQRQVGGKQENHRHGNEFFPNGPTAHADELSRSQAEAPTRVNRRVVAPRRLRLQDHYHFQSHKSTEESLGYATFCGSGTLGSPHL